MTVDETVLTPWGQKGWKSWNVWSPEVDVCRFVGLLARMLQPAVIVETGVGAGKITAELDRSNATWLGYEADPQWRPRDAQSDVTPSADQFGAADLVILDSDWKWRFDEFALWVDHGKSDAVCFIHDAGNGHPDHSGHMRMQRAITGAGLPGMFMRNPRGSWLGIHP